MSQENTTALKIFWKFVHNAVVHPMMAFPWEPRWVRRVHDWTADQWGHTE